MSHGSTKVLTVVMVNGKGIREGEDHKKLSKPFHLFKSTYYVSFRLTMSC